jgi:hypothetical protein
MEEKLQWAMAMGKRVTRVTGQPATSKPGEENGIIETRIRSTECEKSHNRVYLLM